MISSKSNMTPTNTMSQRTDLKHQARHQHHQEEDEESGITLVKRMNLEVPTRLWEDNSKEEDNTLRLLLKVTEAMDSSHSKYRSKLATPALNMAQTQRLLQSLEVQPTVSKRRPWVAIKLRGLAILLKVLLNRRLV